MTSGCSFDTSLKYQRECRSMTHQNKRAPCLVVRGKYDQTIIHIVNRKYTSLGGISGRLESVT